MLYSLSLRIVLNLYSGDDDNEEDENMDVDASKNDNEVAIALTAANQLVKKSRMAKSAPPQEDLADGLNELGMDGYDEGDEGLLISAIMDRKLMVSLILHEGKGWLMKGLLD